jgi:site-specific DNA-methyltransferase (adenine-specific)
MHWCRSSSGSARQWAAAVKVPEGGSGAYARASSGFMGKQWDTGETAFAVEFWAECLRV